jgi:hypothetical protein
VRLDLLELGSSAPYPYRFELEAWSTIPDAIRQSVLRASLSGLQWNSLRLLARCPGADRLVDEIPLLAAAIANLRLLNHSQMRPSPTKPWRSIRRALRPPRSRDRWRRVARLLRWPEERSFFRVLREAGPLAPETWSPMDVAELGSLWAHPWTRKLLQHGPTLTAGRLAALSGALEVVRLGRRLPTRLLLELDDEHDAQNLAGAIYSLARAATWHAPDDLPNFEHLHSLEAIEAATDALTAREQADRPFPPPPLEGAAGIQPLHSAEMLIEEGRAMGHCIGGGGFARRAQAWQGYGYSVRAQLTPERLATVWIVPSATIPGAFCIEQLQGPGNQAVPARLRGRVEQWLRLARPPTSRTPTREGATDPPDPVLHPDWAPAPGLDATAWRSALRSRGAPPPHVGRLLPPAYAIEDVYCNDEIPF